VGWLLVRIRADSDSSHGLGRAGQRGSSTPSTARARRGPRPSPRRECGRRSRVRWERDAVGRSGRLCCHVFEVAVSSRRCRPAATGQYVEPADPSAGTRNSCCGRPTLFGSPGCSTPTRRSPAWPPPAMDRDSRAPARINAGPPPPADSWEGSEGLGDRNAAIRCACDRRTAGWRRTRWGLPGRLRRRR
jgi:hypothetical protein